MIRFGRSTPRRTTAVKVAPQPISHALPTQGAALNRSKLAGTFKHTFTASPDIWHPTLNPSGLFKSTFINETRTKIGEERGLYVDQYVGWNPFGYSGTEKAAYIEMRPLSAEIQAQLAIPFNAAETPVVTGLLSTQRAFSDTYGYFAITAKVCKGPTGMWTALWRTGGSWPPEDDMAEICARDTTKHTFGVHDGDVNPDYSVSNYRHIGENGGPFEDKSLVCGDGFHEYGVLRTQQGAVFYRDGVELRRTSALTGNRASIPLWMVASFQAGTAAQDEWLGALDTNMAPARTYIREFAAYKLA